ncbi:zinc finger protein ENHYDROUS-like [Cornus florida]|uniref:zinc finger protein ENHYDROUS-like n=1 Tax=Cornus florida TaxID=4283 RepID=UPI0028996E1D|nr:zinc finger protein ENHYDROUS-like [Cornus florida]
MPADVDNSSAMNDSTASGEASVSSSGNQIVPAKSTSKKKRNLPGMPDPNAEVIALSPKSLMATNRFVCEICNKGFQRDQNLQLHRRGHNLPWKLRQRSSKEVRKRVYVCPELSCVHHDPSRALGDLTGIKKHFCRKHGEKKWKCEKCSKKYAVQSDWKAHSKICGTREYKCDCGTLFSRRDSFITHRAFCDALAEECAAVTPPTVDENPKFQTLASPPPPPTLPPSTAIISSVLPIRSAELTENSNPTQILENKQLTTGLTGSCSSSSSSSRSGSSSSNVLASLFASSTASESLQPHQTPSFTDLIRSMARPGPTPDLAPSSSTEPISLCLATNHGSSIFGTAGQERRQYAPPPQPAMSATALLQKAVQMGATATNASLLRGFGIVSSTSSPSGHQQWKQMEPENESLAAGLGLGLPCDGSSGLRELMLGTPSVFGPKQTTLDLLGLGMAAGGGPTSGLSMLMTSIEGGFDVAAAAASFGGGDFVGKDIGRSS